ncbi:acyltransferase family protein [Pantoea agglomerans]|uniref:acyltransferase family protein n=1 Tax=Enterobacter agglomerans TaxID=549 RepID=UPI0013DE4C82|nr:acyltransferase [Pantoea agglomerans]
MNDLTDKDFRRFPAADGIRGLAVLIVLIVHSMVMFFPNTYDGLAGSGKIGVWLFFVLSAFLLTNNFIQNGFGSKNIFSYAIGRIIRIIPLYIITLIVYCEFGYFPPQIAYEIFKLNSPWGHLWTIAVEFKFYFLLPLIAYVLIKLSEKFGLFISLLSAIAIIALQQWYYPYFEVKPSSTDMVGYISAFIPGMCCAVILSVSNFRNNTASDMACLLVLVGIMLSIPQIRSIFFGIPNDGYLLNKHVHFSFAWAVLVYFALSSSGKINTIFSSDVLRKLGKWSFSIYLFHWLIYTQLTKHFIGSYFWATLALFIAVLTGGAVYFLIEKPIERFRHIIMRLV